MTVQILVVSVFALLQVPLIMYVLHQRPSYYQMMLSVCLISLLVWTCGYFIELEGLSLNKFDMAITGTKVGYIGKPFTLLAMFFFMARYSRIKVPTWLRVCLVAVHSLIAFCAFTCAHNTLFYSSVGYDEENCRLILGHGPLYMVLIATMLGYFAVDVLFLIRSVRSSANAGDRARSYLIFMVLFSGIAGFAVFLTGVTGGFDTTIVGSFFSAFCLFVLFVKYRLFDSMTLATEQALDAAGDGYVVENAYGQVEYLNPVAQALFKDMPEQNKELLDMLKRLTENDDIIFSGNKVYKTNCHTVSKAGINYGRVYAVSDISDHYYYAKRLQNEVEIKTRDIFSMQRKIVASFANMLEARDGTTGEHIHNCSRYVYELTAELMRRKLCPKNIPADFAEILTQVAPLHDLGKVGIQDSILNKPGRLTQEEFEVIKTHTVLGDSLISKTFTGVESNEYVQMARQVARSHHESWDGKGYPDGLTGNDIPFCAQIMAVCDVYDALRSKRPYKEAYSKEESLSIIAGDRGKKFNPDIVDVFLELSDKLY